MVPFWRQSTKKIEYVACSQKRESGSKRVEMYLGRGYAPAVGGVSTDRIYRIAKVDQTGQIDQIDETDQIDQIYHIPAQ